MNAFGCRDLHRICYYLGEGSTMVRINAGAIVE